MLLLARNAAMSSALTREYAERTSESKPSLDVEKLNNRKRDSEATKGLSVRAFISFAFRFWTKFIAVLQFCGFQRF